MTNDRFREALNLDFKDMKVKDKTQLKTLMRIAGYRQSKDYKKEPSQEQLDYAWFYVNKIHGKKLRILKTKYGHKATQNIYIAGKLYRKGQFIPKQK